MVEKKINTILFPIDLSDASPRIVPWVKLLAEKFQAGVKVLFVVRAFEHYSGMGVSYSYIADFEGEITKQAEKTMNEFMEANFSDPAFQAKVIPGYPAEEILKFAEEESVDLIVIGTHGRKGLERIIFGSVAEHVVKHSKIPVFTVNPFRQED